MGVAQRPGVEQCFRPEPTVELAEVRSRFQYQNTLVAPLSQHPRHDSSSSTAANNDGIRVAWNAHPRSQLSSLDDRRMLYAAVRCNRRNTVCKMPPLR